jgi:hypothetical protein
LRFASLGAAPKVAFTVYVAVTEPAGPSAPFKALTLADLDADLLRAGRYAQAVEDAVSAHNNQAFVLESRALRPQLRVLDGTRLGTFIDNDATVTRMSSIVPADALTEDAVFHTPFEGVVSRDRYVKNSIHFETRELGMGSLATLLLAGAWRRRRRSRAA